MQVKENQLHFYKDISMYFKEEIVSAEKKGMAEKGCYYKKYGGEHGRIKEWEYNQMRLPKKKELLIFKIL